MGGACCPCARLLMRTHPPSPPSPARSKGCRRTDRELLFLRFVAERTHGEIGAILGCNAAASKMRVSRAARRLRHELDM